MIIQEWRQKDIFRNKELRKFTNLSLHRKYKNIFLRKKKTEDRKGGWLQITMMRQYGRVVKDTGSGVSHAV